MYFVPYQFFKLFANLFTSSTVICLNEKVFKTLPGYRTTGMVLQVYDYIFNIFSVQDKINQCKKYFKQNQEWNKRNRKNQIVNNI